jgi:hypothetical protein|tara:strand:- start:213 stop:350 length:138 start_codon:yes stop_codon:yes gene_type:complete
MQWWQGERNSGWLRDRSVSVGRQMFVGGAVGKGFAQPDIGKTKIE